MVTVARKLKDTCSLEGKLWQTLMRIKKQRHHFVNKGPSRRSYDFSSSYIWIWELDYKEGWVPKNWCFQNVVLEKTLESPSDCKEIKPVNSKQVNPEYSLEGLMLKLKLQYFGHLMWRVTGKDPDAGKDWAQNKKGMTEDKMVSWHHWLNGYHFEQTQGDSEGERGLVQFMESQRVRQDLGTEQHQLWL